MQKGFLVQVFSCVQSDSLVFRLETYDSMLKVVVEFNAALNGHHDLVQKNILSQLHAGIRETNLSLLTLLLLQ